MIYRNPHLPFVGQMGICDELNWTFQKSDC